MPKPKKVSQLPVGSILPMNLDEVSVNIVAHAMEFGTIEMFTPIPTGLQSIDSRTGGGLHGGDLIVLGGVPNVGKTAAVMQIAASAAESGALAIVICFEHSTQVLWERLLIQQSFEEGIAEHTTSDDIRKAYIQVINEREKTGANLDYINQLIGRIPNGLKAWANMSRIQNHIWLITGDSRYTSMDVIEAYIDMAGEYNKRILLMVDYVQRVPVYDSNRTLTPEDRIDRVTQGLKSIALKKMDSGMVVPVLGVAAADAEGLRGGRVHLENLFGTSLLSYEPDVGIMMNKDPEITPEGYPIVRFALEKNRRGPSDIEFKHKYYGSAYTFNRTGELVGEKDSWQTERRALREKLIA